MFQHLTENASCWACCLSEWVSRAIPSSPPQCGLGHGASGDAGPLIVGTRREHCDAVRSALLPGHLLWETVDSTEELTVPGATGATGGMAVVGAMATNEWKTIRDGVARLFDRGGEDRPEVIETQLDEDVGILADKDKGGTRS